MTATSLLLTLVLAAAQENPADDLRKLAEQLDADDIRVRGKAEEEILSRWKSWQESDLAALAGARSQSLESSSRMKTLLDRIRIRQVAGEPLLQSVDGIEARLLGKDEDRLIDLLLSFGLLFKKGSAPVSDMLNVLRWVKENRSTPRVEETLKALEGAGLKDDPKLLLAQLKDPLPYRRFAAITALLQTRDRSLAGDLVPLLKDPSEELRLAVFRALLHLRAVDQSARIVPLLAERDSVLRSDAARLLGRLGARDSRGDVAKLLKDPLPFVRAEALRSLATIGGPEVETAVIDRLKDPDLGVRREAARCLGALGAKGLVRRLQDLLSSEQPGARAAGLLALTEAGEEEGLPIFVEALRHADPEVRWMGARGLGRLGARRHARDLLPLLGDPNVWTRLNAVDALAKIGSEAEVEPVAGLLKDENLLVRATALEALGRMGAVGKAKELREALKDPAPRIKESALWALSRLPPSGDSGEIEGLFDDPSQDVRAEAVGLLQSWRVDGARPRIAALLRDKLPRVRLRAAEALLALGGEDAVEQVLPLLDDEWGIVRGRVAVAVGRTLAASGGKELAKTLQPRFRRLEWDRRWEASIGASVGLVYLGGKSKKEILDLLEDASYAGPDLGPKLSQDLCWALALLLEPESSRKLAGETTLAGPVDSIEGIVALAKGAGLTIDPASGAHLSGTLPANARLSAIDVLQDRMLPYGIYVEGATLRLRDMAPTLEAWRQRLR